MTTTPHKTSHTTVTPTYNRLLQHTRHLTPLSLQPTIDYYTTQDISHHCHPNLQSTTTAHNTSHTTVTPTYNRLLHHTRHLTPLSPQPTIDYYTTQDISHHCHPNLQSTTTTHKTSHTTVTPTYNRLLQHTIHLTPLSPQPTIDYYTTQDISHHCHSNLQLTTTPHKTSHTTVTPTYNRLLQHTIHLTPLSPQPTIDYYTTQDISHHCHPNLQLTTTPHKTSHTTVTPTYNRLLQHTRHLTPLSPQPTIDYYNTQDISHHCHPSLQLTTTPHNTSHTTVTPTYNRLLQHTRHLTPLSPQPTIDYYNTQDISHHCHPSLQLTTTPHNTSHTTVTPTYN